MFFSRIASIILFGLIMFTQTGLHALQATGNIPFLKAPVKIDGIMSPGEWNDAAVLRRIFNKGNRIAGKPRTDFYLKYSNDALYVGVICYENEAGYPEAYKRSWNDLLFRNDDAIQVMLGVRDKNVVVRGKINVGGYDGAIDGKMAKADYYYQYTVNAVGSLQRTFNETPLENKLFEAVSKISPGKYWVVEMKIPFSSCGLKNVSGKVINANLFRFRPPVMTGWFYPNFGGYYSMPFGKFKFLLKGQEKAKTNESYPELGKPVPKLCKAYIQYSPLSGAIIGKAKISGYKKTLYGILKVSGKTTIKKKLIEANMINHDARKMLNAPLTAHVICKIKSGDQVAREAEFTIVDEQDTVISKASKKCKAVKAPEWLGTRNGIEYVSEKFPAPWTSPIIKNNSSELVDKTIKFNHFGLPQSILFKDARGGLIAGQAEIEIKQKGKKLNFKGLSFKCFKAKVITGVDSVLKSGNIILQTKTRMEPDGFMVVKFRLKNLPVKEINSISLKIPLKRENAKFILRGASVQNIGQLTGAGYRNSAASLWVGTYDKGLSFSFDTALFRSKNIRHQMEVVENKDISWLVFNFIDGENQLKEDMIFRFFLQPTPTKPLPAKKIRAWTKWQWEKWSRWHGYPDIGKIPKLTKWVEKLKKEEKPGLLYSCQGLQQNAPHFKEFRSDLELLPRWRYYKNLGKDCFATCKRGPEGDLQLWGWKKLIKDAGVRGLISDGLINAWGDSNPAHPHGCGQKQKIEWNSSLQSRVVAQRTFLKRLFGLFTDTGEPYCIIGHTGGGIDINVMSFIDGYMEGEQLQRYNRGYFLPLAIYAVGYNGAAWGWRSMFWNKQWRNYQSIESSLAYALLFNTEFMGNKSTENRYYDLELYKDFQPQNSEFCPFWKKNKYIKLDSGHSLCSVYRSKNKAMIVISNLRYIPDTYKLDISKLFPGRKLRIRELLSNKKLQQNKVINGKLTPHSCDVIIVNVDDDIVSEPKVESRGMGENWKSNASKANGVVAEYPVKLDNTENLMLLKGKPYKPAAKASFKKFTLGQNGTVQLLMIPQQRFFIGIGPLRLSHDYGWSFAQNGKTSIKGIVNKHYPVKYNEVHKLLLRLKDGFLTVWFDGDLIIDNKKCDIPKLNNVVSIGTWHSDKLLFKSELISNFPQGAPAVSAFDIGKYHKSDWKVNTKAKGVKANYDFKLPDGRKGISFGSKPYQSGATVKCDKKFGSNAYIDLSIKLPGRFRIKIGPITLTYGGGPTSRYGWYVKGNAQKRGNGWILTQVPIKKDKFVNMKISIKNKVLNVTYDNMLVVQDLPMEIPPAGNVFSINTWWKDKVEFTVNEISSTPKDIVFTSVKHPIMSK